MRPAPHLLAAMVFLAAAIPTASAHSLKEVEAMLGDREKYFQPVDKPTPEFVLRDADGKTVAPADLRGKVVVLHFIYTRCPDVCPLHAERIAEVQEMVNQTPMKEQVRFVTVTTDPAHDSLEVLKDYGPGHGLDPGNWLPLTTLPDQPEDTTRQLAQAFGHKFKVTDDTYQLHGIVTHVIDKEGRWRANFHGLKFAPVNLVTFINALTNDSQHPHGHQEQSWWDRVRRLF